MENDAHYTFVGGMVIAVSLLLAASFIWLMGGASKIAYQPYSIYFHNESMDGLDINSAVTMRGIKMGEVTNYTFVRGKQESVRVDIKLDKTAPIHIDSRAYVKRSFITGLAVIEIHNPHASSPLLPTTSANGQYPIIAEGSSDLDKMTTSLSQMAKNGAQVLDKLNLVLSDDNRAAVAKTLRNVQVLSGQLIANKHTLDDTLRSFKDSADTVRQTASSLGRTSADMDEQIKLLGGKAGTTFTKVDTTLDDLQQQSVIISRQLQRLTDAASYQLNQIGADVHRSADTITSTGQNLSNPRALIFNSGKPEPAPGER